MNTLNKAILVLWTILFLVPPVTAGMGGGSRNKGGDPELKQIMAAAKNYAKPYSSPSGRYEFSFRKRVGNFAKVNRIPKPGTEGEIETIILQKVNGTWVGQTIGTCFAGDGMTWEKRVPELFK